MVNKIDRARVIARLAHTGQKYGSADYFRYHVENVVRRCEENKHCTYGIIEVAYLHDILEDTKVTADDLDMLGVTPDAVRSVELLTHVTGTYAEYVQGIVDSGDLTAAFVKFHDLIENRYNCMSIANGYADPMSRNRSRSLLVRYEKALTTLRGADLYHLYEDGQS